MLCAAQSFTALTFDQAKEKAAKENKIILVDVSNASMKNASASSQEKSVLSLPGVKEFIDANIVSIRMDMGTEDGKKFAPLLQMNMYPTYAFMMPYGDLISVLSPYSIGKNPSLFLEKAKEAMAVAKEKWSNKRSIAFQTVSFDEALQIAAKENKLIFIDAYTDNCQPCMRMAKNVFTLDRVADFYNSNFINLTMNLGTEHTDLAKKYNTSGYPSYLFIDSKGELVHFASGYTEADEFLKYGAEALNKKEIQFQHGSWSDVVKLAKKENKPIFIDCYTVWCGPCKMMAKDVFTNSKVAEYFNSNFINYKSDMEKGEGVELKGKFEVSAYPTFLFIDVDGKIANRLVGSMPAEEFLAKAKEGFSEKGLARMQEKYSKGERSAEFLKDYLTVLEAAYLSKDAQKVAEELFEKTDKSQLLNPEYWTIFENYIQSPNSEIFKYAYSIREQLYKAFSKENVERKFYMVWCIGSREFVKKENGTAVLDVKGYDQYKKRLKDEKVDQLDNIVFNADLSNAEQLGQWDKYVKLVDARIRKMKLENIPDFELYNWGLRIDKNCQDQKLRSIAGKWFADMLPIFEAREAKRKEATAKSGMMAAMSMVNYAKEYQKLCKSLEGK